MKTRIGKYTLYETDKYFRIFYRFSFSDFIGMVMPLLGVLIGFLLLLISYKNLEIESLLSFDFIFFFTLGCVLLWWFGRIFMMSLWNPPKGLIEVKKIEKLVIVRDFMKADIIPISEISSIYYVVEEDRKSKPKEKYGMLKIKKKNNEILDCIVINSSKFIDTGNDVDLDIIMSSRGIRDGLLKVIREC